MENKPESTGINIRKFEPIDCLRGLAALMVVVVHSSIFGKNQGFPLILNQFVYQGQRGVQLFYIISAFTLFYTFDLRKNEKNANVRFLLRRFFRIAPLYYFAIILYLTIRYYGLRHDVTGEFPSIYNIISNFTFIHGFSPFWSNDIVPGGWSIGVEFPFYFALPILFHKIKNLKQAFQYQIYFIVIGIILPFILLSFKNSVPYDPWVAFVNQIFLNQLIHFGFGIILYFLIVKGERITNEHFKFIYILILEFFAITSLSMYFLRGDWIVHNLIMSYLFSFGFAIAVYFLMKDQLLILNNRILMFLGKISYGLYLIHFFCFYILEYFGLNNLILGQSGKVALANFAIRFFLCLVFASGLANILHIIIEKPFQNLGKKLIKRYL